MKLSYVAIVSSEESRVSDLPEGSELKFLLARETRRWPTIVNHFGGEVEAWAAAVGLCRGGLVVITCTVVAARIGPPIRWQWTSVTAAHAAARRQRMAEAREEARRLLKRDDSQADWVEAWLGDVTKSGVLAGRPSDGPALITAAASCLAALPLWGSGPVGRGELAARYGGARGAHALDDGHRLTALVLRGIAAATGTLHARNAAERRALWDSAGVVCDTTSATVLVANIRPQPTGLIARQLCERAEARLPTHLTARDLAAEQLRLPDSLVHVCENPRVLEAALDRGVMSPLVCTSGNPTTVTTALLRQLTASGARIAYRGDFDWPGLSIANRLIDRLGCRTWLFDTTTYVDAVQSMNGDVVPLSGTPVEAGWDGTLSITMRRTGAAIHEELLVDRLVSHLLGAVDAPEE